MGVDAGKDLGGVGEEKKYYQNIVYEVLKE